MALGLTGRYLGGQATQQEQRFDARGADPDQLQAGSVRPWIIALPLPFAGSRHAAMSGNHRGDRSLVVSNILTLIEERLPGDFFDQ